MKIHKTVATRAVPFGPDMHQIVCRLGRGGRERRGGEGGDGGRKGEWREGKGRRVPPLDLNPGDATVHKNSTKTRLEFY